MNNHPLYQYVGSLRTSVGAALPGFRALFRGKDLHRELGKLNWMALFMYGITGRQFKVNEIRLFEAIWTHTCYPDTRIWNNRVAAMAGSARSTGGLGISGALAISEARIFGLQPFFCSISFFIKALDAVSGGQRLEDYVDVHLQQNQKILGYGRPINSYDERIAPIRKLAKELNLANGPHHRIARKVEAILLRRRKHLRLNYAGEISALCADIGLTPREHYLFTYPIFLGGMMPCFVEAADKPPLAVMPISVESVRYIGKAPRSWTTAV